VFIFLGAFAKLRKAPVSFVMSVRLSVCLSVCLYVCMSVRLYVRPSAATRWVLWNLIYGDFSKILSGKFKFCCYLTSITGTLHEDLCSYVIICSWILLIMINLSDKSCRENQSTHFIWKKYARATQATHDSTVLCTNMRFACLVTKKEYRQTLLYSMLIASWLTNSVWSVNVLRQD
jgi:hypothetical protein